jgi:hypothetical protein
MHGFFSCNILQKVIFQSSQEFFYEFLRVRKTTKLNSYYKPIAYQQSEII